MKKIILTIIFIMPFVSICSEYYWETFGYPKEINHLNSIDIDDDKIIAVGEKGFILTSDDRGNNFQIIDTDINEDFLKVIIFNSTLFYLTNKSFYNNSFQVLNTNESKFTNFFIQNDFFYLTNDKGLIYKSEDLGKNWEDIIIPELQNEKILNIEFYGDNWIIIVDNRHFYIYNNMSNTTEKINIPNESIGLTSNLFNNELYLGCRSLKYRHQGFFKYNLISDEYVEIENELLPSYVSKIKVINDSTVFFNGIMLGGFIPYLIRTKDNFKSFQSISNSFFPNEIKYDEINNEIIAASKNGHIFKNDLISDSTVTIHQATIPTTFENISNFNSKIIASKGNRLYEVQREYFIELVDIDSSDGFSIQKIEFYKNHLYILKEKNEPVKDSNGTISTIYSYKIYKTDLINYELVDSLSSIGRFREIKQNDKYLGFCFTQRILLYENDNLILNIEYEDGYPFFDVDLLDDKIAVLSFNAILNYNYLGEQIDKIEIQNLNNNSKLIKFDDEKVIYTIHNQQTKTQSFYILDLITRNSNLINNLQRNESGIASFILNDLKLIDGNLFALQLSAGGYFAFSDYDSENWEVVKNNSMTLSTPFPNMLIHDNYVYTANGIISRLNLGDVASVKSNSETKKINLTLINNTLEFQTNEIISNVKVFDYYGKYYELKQIYQNNYFVNNLKSNSLILITFDIGNERYIEKLYVGE